MESQITNLDQFEIRQFQGKQPAPGSKHCSVSPSPANILLIDNDTDDAQAICNLLKATKFNASHVNVAASRAKAAKLMTAQHFDLVVSNFWLGNKTTISLVNEISKKNPHLPVIMLSQSPSAGTSFEDADSSLFYLNKSALCPKLLEETMHQALQAHAALTT